MPTEWSNWKYTGSLIALTAGSFYITREMVKMLSRMCYKNKQIEQDIDNLRVKYEKNEEERHLLHNRYYPDITHPQPTLPGRVQFY
jgi:hypothetical protein